MHHPKIAAIVQRDPRYAYEAYEFVFDALKHSEKLLGRTQAPDPKQGLPPLAASRSPSQHVTGAELLHGVRDLALREFGLMARVVFRLWGINRTDDFGDIVFNLVEAGLMRKTDQDSRGDFHNVFDLDQALVQEYRIQVESPDS
jgi:uncharacterized repeat protein (TIGR04138 family)